MQLKGPNTINQKVYKESCKIFLEHFGNLYQQTVFAQEVFFGER